MNKLTTRLNALYFSTLLILIFILVVAWQMVFIPFIEKSEQIKADLLLSPYAPMFETLVDEKKFDELDILIATLMLLKNEDSNQPLILTLSLDLAEGKNIRQINDDRTSLFVNKVALFSPATFELIGSLEVAYNDHAYKEIVNDFNLIIIEFIIIFTFLFVIGQRLLIHFIRPLSKLAHFLNDADTLKAGSLPEQGSHLSAEIKSVWDATKVLLNRIREREEELKVEHELAQSALREKINADLANQSKSRFLANMSHEIRTPLTAIVGFADTLKNSDLSPQQRLYSTGAIVRNGSHLLEIINDTLDLSKIESDKLEIENINISLVRLIKDVAVTFEPMVKEKGLDFVVDYQFPLPKKIQTDPTRLRQILYNLLGNAKKFTESGSIKLSVSFDVEARQVIISVKDSGIGLSDAQAKKVFSPFSQADASTTRKYGGTGLGLTISRKLAKMLGGDIQLVNNKTTGATGAEFVVTIASGVANKDLGKESGKESDKALNAFYANMSEYGEVAPAIENNLDLAALVGNVLVAEDTKDIQDLIRYYLEPTGVDVMFVNNGEEAFDLAVRRGFDLIFMDMQMPVLDGLGAAQKLRASGFKNPIIALSANVMLEDQDLYRASGLDFFLAKPMDKNAIYRAIKKYAPQGRGAIRTQSIVDKTERKRQSRIRLARQFKARLPAWLDGISSAIRIKNQAELIQISHVLRGLGSSFGYPEITITSGKIEDSAKNGNFEIAAARYSELENFCNEIVFNSKDA